MLNRLRFSVHMVLIACFLVSAPAAHGAKDTGSSPPSPPSPPGHPAAIGTGGAIDTATTGTAEQARVQRAYGRLPLYFIPNHGQVDKNVVLYEQAAGHSTFFTRDGIYLSLKNPGE